MKDFPIPVVAMGMGSQADEDESLEYMPMPQGMDTFQLPRLAEGADEDVLAGALAVLEQFHALMREASFGVGPAPAMNLLGLPEGVVRLVNEALGQGEVSARVDGQPAVHIQETVFAGVWRVQSLDEAGQLLADRLEASPMPAEVRAAVAEDLPRSRPVAGAAVMNAPAVVHEVESASLAWQPGKPAHIVNLTLLPMTPDDLEYLVAAFGLGRAVILSRGYGNCRISATALARTWWVQYFNSTDTLILNTLEVTDLPDVAPAAEEDFVDSIERLAEWIAQIREG